MSSKKLRALAAGAIAAATLAALAPMGAANAATKSMTMANATAPNIVINGNEGNMKGHSFVAVKIGEYQNANYDDTTPNPGPPSIPGTLTSVSVGTVAEVNAAAKDALLTAKGSGSAEDPAYEGNPVGEVASKWLGYGTSGDDTTSNTGTAVSPDNHGWNGKLRTFVTDLMKSTATNAAGNKFSDLVTAQAGNAVSAVAGTAPAYSASIPVSTPGIYVVVDMTSQPVSGSKALKNAIPMLVSTGVTYGGKDYTRLGTVDLGAVQMKNDVPTVNKALDTSAANDASIGGQLHYKLTSTVPLTTGFDHYIFTMTDHPGTGLTYDSSVTPVVKVGGTALNAGTDYTVNHSEDGAGNTTYIIFDLTPSIINQTYQKDIVITYALKVNDNAVSGQALKNGVTLSYSNDNTPGKQPTSSNTPSTDADGNVVNCVPTTGDCGNGATTNDTSQDGGNSPSTVNSYFHHFNVMKQKKVNGAGLAGATFQVTKKGSSDVIKFLKTGNGVYRKAADQGNTSATGDLKAFDGADVSPSGDLPYSNGQLQIDGLSDGVYTLKETGAPAGFSSTFLPSTDVQVGGNATTPANSEFANTADAVYGLIAAKGTVASGATPASLVAVSMAGAGAVVVNNVNSISQLPLTGGVGILLMLLVIVVLAMIVAALVITRRKLRK